MIAHSHSSDQVSYAFVFADVHLLTILQSYRELLTWGLASRNLNYKNHWTSA